MLYKRSEKPGAVYWTRFTLRGREVRVSTGTNRKTLAEEFEKQLRDQIWREQQLGEIAYTWDDATARWLQEKTDKRSLSRDKCAFAAVADVLDGKFLVDIDEDTIGELVKHLLAGRKKARKASGVNRDLACVQSVLRRCLKWKYLTVAPTIERLPAQKPPRRWERPERIAKLREELPPHAVAIASFAVAVGLRSKNIFTLRWALVDIPNRCFSIEIQDFKGKRTVGFPLSDDAIDILKGQIGKHPVYVFTDHLGRAPIKSIKTCWKKACKRADLEGFRVHDLRHTWTAWHKLKGTPPRAIKELGGWASMQMLEEYGHINPTDFAEFVNNLPTKNGTRPKRAIRK